VWLHEEAMLPGRGYLLKAGATTAPAQIETVQYKINVNSLKQVAGATLGLNEIGACVIGISRATSFDTYRDNRSSGSFILIDRMTNATVAAGMVESPLDGPGGFKDAPAVIEASARARIKGQNPGILWFERDTVDGGASQATLVERKLHLLGRHTHLIDADRLRQGLNQDLGRTIADQVEETRRLHEVARICSEAGLIVLISDNRDLSPGSQFDDVTLVRFQEPGTSLEVQAEALVQSLCY